MSSLDLSFYGRAAVWSGSGLLVLMAVSGAQVGFITVLAVLAVLVGIVLLLYSIPFRATSEHEERLFERTTNG